MKIKGFTLIELMVVVAIIGILSSVAIPNFRKYQAQAKTSEAKLQLAAIYSAESAFYTDTDTYSTCLSAMGYDPGVPEVGRESTDTRYYSTGFSAPSAESISFVNLRGSSTGCTATLANNTYFLVSAAGRKVAGINVSQAGQFTGPKGTAVKSFNDAGYTADATVYSSGGSGTRFVAMAVGAVDKKAVTGSGTCTNCDVWAINENKMLTHAITGY